MRLPPRLLILLLAGVPAAAPLAQDVSGRAFEDRNGDGIRQTGEPLLAGVALHLFGTRAGGGAVDQSVASDAAGLFVFSPGDGCYLLSADDPSGWRLGPTRSDGFPSSTPGYTFPVGQPRFAGLEQGIAHLKAGAMRFTAMGDSIARNFNLCSSAGSFWYSKQVQARLSCAAPSATISLDQAAVLGEHTDDLLVDDTANLNNVFRAIEVHPDLITISMIGNDLLDVDPGASPTQQQINTAVAEILDSRQNLQEALSALTSQVPNADIVLNSLYDNEAYNCATGSPSAFHRAWLPIVDRILRDLAWGQTRRASINEVAADFAHEDQLGSCLGYTGMICRDIFNLDDIHPNNNGYTIVREKLWEAVGGVTLGSGDALGRVSIPDADHPFLRRVRRLLPSRWEVLNGAAVTSPQAAMDDADGGAPARVTLGIGAEEYRLSGFPDWYDEIQIVRAIAGVRYRTAGTVNDDFYRMEASVTGVFRPPAGYNYTATNWNFYTPLAGGGGPNQPVEHPDYPTAKLLVLPNVASYREVSSTLTKNPVLGPGAGEYDWPAPTAGDLATTVIRVASAPVAATAGNDNYQVELDAAWVDLYGWEKPRPPEAGNLTAEPAAGGGLKIAFDAVAGAQRYNLYLGRAASVAGTGSYDHGASAPAGPFCDVAVTDAGGGRLQILLDASALPAADAYILVTAHVDGVESPAGARSDGVEIDRSQSICR